MRLTGRLREKGYTDVSVQLPAWKDWNEDLKARGGMDAVCAQPHPKLQMLEQAMQAASQQMYQQQAQQNADAGNASSNGGKDDFVDAEFEEKK